jgi:hypothetical protein
MANQVGFMSWVVACGGLQAQHKRQPRVDQDTLPPLDLPGFLHISTTVQQQLLIVFSIQSVMHVPVVLLDLVRSPCVWFSDDESESDECA